MKKKTVIKWLKEKGWNQVDENLLEKGSEMTKYRVIFHNNTMYIHYRDLKGCWCEFNQYNLENCRFVDGTLTL